MQNIKQIVYDKVNSLSEEKGKEYSFAHIGYNNVNDLATIYTVLDLVLSDEQIVEAEKTLMEFLEDVKELPPLESNFKGGRLVQSAIAILFLEVTYISDESDKELTENALICLNYIKYKNPNLKLITTQLEFNEADQDFEFVYQIEFW